MHFASFRKWPISLAASSLLAGPLMAIQDPPPATEDDGNNAVEATVDRDRMRSRDGGRQGGGGTERRGSEGIGRPRREGKKNEQKERK